MKIIKGKTQVCLILSHVELCEIRAAFGCTSEGQRTENIRHSYKNVYSFYDLGNNRTNSYTYLYSPLSDLCKKIDDDLQNPL